MPPCSGPRAHDAEARSGLTTRHACPPAYDRLCFSGPGVMGRAGRFAASNNERVHRRAANRGDRQARRSYVHGRSQGTVPARPHDARAAKGSGARHACPRQTTEANRRARADCRTDGRSSIMEEQGEESNAHETVEGAGDVPQSQSRTRLCDRVRVPRIHVPVSPHRPAISRPSACATSPAASASSSSRSSSIYGRIGTTELSTRPS